MEFLKDVRSEMRKVVSPTRAEVAVDHHRRPRHASSSSPPTSGWWTTSSARAITRLIAIPDQALTATRQHAVDSKQMHEEGTLTMAAEEQNPEAQNPERRTADRAACPAGQREFQVVHHPRLLRLRAQGARVAGEPHPGLRPAEPHRPHHDPDRARHRAAQRQEVHHRARLPARLRAGRDGTRQRPLARHQEHAARHRLPWNRRQSGRALRGRRSAPSSSAPRPPRTSLP